MKRKGKLLPILLTFFLFLCGSAVFLYPYIHKASVDTAIEQEVQSYYKWLEDFTFPAEDTGPDGSVSPGPVPLYPELLDAIQSYNQTLWEEKQSGLKDPWSYTQPSFSLTEYGLESEIFGVISIPKLELKMPLYLGATTKHLADGAAHLSQTSLPIGGNNTNCVIAGHRGFNGATYFRYITDLIPGDKVIITNMWETLIYEVCETKVIKPYEVEEIHIQESKDLLTLLTCHPYASGGKYRYLVYCQRTQ